MILAADKEARKVKEAKAKEALLQYLQQLQQRQEQGNHISAVAGATTDVARAVW